MLSLDAGNRFALYFDGVIHYNECGVTGVPLKAAPPCCLLAGKTLLDWRETQGKTSVGKQVFEVWQQLWQLHHPTASFSFAGQA